MLEMKTEELGKRVTRGTTEAPVQISGVKRLLEVLDGVYLEELHKEKYNSFRNFKRPKNQSVREFSYTMSSES